MKLWQKDFEVNKKIEAFTIGRDRELDLLLATHDILGTLAHIQMLESIGLLEREALRELNQELRALYREAEQGRFAIEEGVEDVHSQVELMLTRRLGDTGKKIHSGRSRNDQVMLDLKLYIRAQLREVLSLVRALFEQLMALSKRYQNVLIPGYTHYQIAMPSSFGLWFGAYAESLIDDVHLLYAAFRVANKNPLGSAAGYGSSFPLNRRMTTELLGFDDLNYNVVYAQMGRGKTERLVADALASVASTLSRMAQDVTLYMSQNFGFLSFPDHLTTGSSIMPHKKNPDVFELIRSKCNKINALPNEIALITTNLASGYHRDLQTIKEGFLLVFEELKNCLDISRYMLENVLIEENAIRDPKYKYLFSVEAVNREVLRGTPFRDAYKKIGMAIQEGHFEPERKVAHTHEGSIGALCHEDVARLMREACAQFPFEHIEQATQALLNS